MDNYGGHMGQGRARDSQARRDAVTVEIGYALCSAAFLAALVFAVVAGPAWVFGLSGTAQTTLIASGATLGAVLFAVRVVSVLIRFARENDGTGRAQPIQPGRTNPDS
ncbi:hypothetical protein GCM10023084_35830 [Streptomyces lacrimifluminis]|uniref:Uncharacterized protein n=1 Tax=Streptomyces lacrimifluminis TaxID=1500077 RepID=A0A917L1A0_9ACTN|nr:DUF6332 family protein [Streptomyces lacrimifluminis]GGJ37764.1 hypothetical protein GCM10012282_38120 [Streptomyces lacrimifluminis]